MLYWNRPKKTYKIRKFYLHKKITSEIKSLPTMKPTGFANQLFQNSREENSHLTGILAVNKEHSPTLFYKTSITLILNPTRKKYKKVKLQTLSIDEIILNKTLRNKVQLKENTLRSGWGCFRITKFLKVKSPHKRKITCFKICRR